MIFEPLAISGAYRIIAEPHRDTRGSFARIYCPEEFTAHAIPFTSTQLNLSENLKRCTLRGLHFQEAPHAEAKLIHVIRGRAFDVIVDLRAGSASYGKWVGIQLDAAAPAAVFAPEGCAHGFLTLADDTALLYQMGRPYIPGHERGVRWNDPAFGIAWPAAPEMISERDATWPDFVRTI